MEPVPRALQVVEEASRAALVSKIEEWLPTFNDGQVGLFERIVSAHRYASYEDLPMENLRNLYDLCARTVEKRSQ